MSKLELTQSLIGAWNYMHLCPEEYQDKAYDEFINALHRTPKEATKAIQNGIDFENEVYKVAEGGQTSLKKWENGINAVSSIVNGSIFQFKAQRELVIGKYNLLVYGILDALKASIIYDVKFCNKSFGSTDLAGKYLESPQHPAYFFLVPEATEFQYLVSDGEDLYTEVYTRSITRPFEDIAKEFIKSLEDMNLINVYIQHWTITEDTKFDDPFS